MDLPIMDNKLTQQEIKYLTRFLHMNTKPTKPTFSYLAIGMLALLTFLGIALGIFYKSKDGILMAVFLGTIATIIYFKTMNDIKISQIIRKILSKHSSENT
jgi:hypothetical protein